MKSIYLFLFFFICILSNAKKNDTIDQNDTFLIKSLQERLKNSNDLMLNISNNLSSIYMASNLFSLHQLNKTRDSLEHLLTKLKKEKQKNQNKAKVKKILNNFKNDNNSKPSSNFSKNNKNTFGLPPKSAYYNYNEVDRSMNLLKVHTISFWKQIYIYIYKVMRKRFFPFITNIVLLEKSSWSRYFWCSMPIRRHWL